LKQQGERWRVSLFGDRLHVITEEDVSAGIRTTTEKLNAAGIAVLSARPGVFSLEDVFIATVEKARLIGKVGTED
jgi:ABC-2 type transport system ATP-binding protein